MQNVEVNYINVYTLLYVVAFVKVKQEGVLQLSCFCSTVPHFGILFLYMLFDFGKEFMKCT